MKFLLPVLVLMLCSGCCRYLGVCTSASVHTSIAVPDQLAQQSSCPQ